MFLSLLAQSPYQNSRVEIVSDYFQDDIATTIPEALSVAARDARPDPGSDDARAPGGQLMYIDGLDGPVPLWREKNNALRTVSSFPTGTRVTRIEEKGKWSRVITPDAQWGWMETRYLTHDPPLVAGE
jgi:hypothetical protein